MNKLFILVLIMLLAGCAGTTFENRITCTVSQGEIYVVSKWGNIGITSKISDKDAAIVCPVVKESK